MMHAEEVLHALMTRPLQRTDELQDDAVGIYALADHEGRRSYIGCTKAANENFHKRIHQRHRTGSETHQPM
jgi:DNA polymerase-3 subunit epsilon